jgi:tRNA (cmo5U34)-methyltransferase
MPNSDTLRGWGEKERVTYFLDNADAIVPKRQEQLAFLVDLFGWHQEEPIVVLDLGAGFGALTEQILTRYPRSTVICVDGSAEMMKLAQERLAPYGQRVRLHLADLAFPSWHGPLHGPFHAVVSALAIHHLPDERKQQLSHEIFQLLSPGGLFLNNDVVSAPPLLQEQFATLWYREIQAQEERRRGVKRSLAAIQAEMEELLRVADHESQLTPLSVQLDWLCAAGFQSVDCVWKYLDLAIFGGMKA